MTGPKNLAGVLVAFFFGGLLLFSCFALGWDDTTRRGMPVWLLGSVGLACFAALAVQSWRKPRKDIDDDGPVVTSGAKAVLTASAVWFLLPLVVVAVGFGVALFR